MMKTKSVSERKPRTTTNKVKKDEFSDLSVAELRKRLGSSANKEIFVRLGHGNTTSYSGEEIIALLDESVVAAEKAQKALEAGKGVDCDEVKEFQRIVREVNANSHVLLMEK
jgi:hypothetical protein